MSKKKWTFEYARTLPFLTRKEATRVWNNSYDDIGGYGDYNIIEVDAIDGRYTLEKKPAWMRDIQQFKDKGISDLMEFLVEREKDIPEDTVFTVWLDFEIMFSGSREEVIGELFDYEIATIYKVFHIDTWMKTACVETWREKKSCSHSTVEVNLTDMTRDDY